MGWRRHRRHPGVELASDALASAALGALLALAVMGGVWHFWPAEPAPKGRPAIAVLPFDNLGGDEATGRLADGITEDIITDLARFTTST